MTGFALRYSLLPPSAEISDTDSVAYGGDIWLSVQTTYNLSLNSNIVTVYTDKVSPQPSNNILSEDSTGLDTDIAMTNAALLSGSGYEYTALDLDNTAIYQANMNLQSDLGGSALIPCATEGCGATADLNLIYFSYTQSGDTATLQFNPADRRSLLYRLTSGYGELGNGGFFSAQSYYVAIVPVPATGFLLGSGLLGLMGISRRKHGS